MKIINILFLFAIINYKSFASTPLITLASDLENVVDSNWINCTSIISGQAYSGNKFSTTDSAHQYGFGYRGEFPEVCQNKNLIIHFSEKLRTNLKGHESGMVASVGYGDSSIFWNFFNASVNFKTTGEWTQVDWEISVPRSLTGKGYKLSIYLWNKDGKANVDLDDLELRFEEMVLPTFLPSSPAFKSRPERYDQKADLKNAVLWINKKDGGVFIERQADDTLISTIALVTEIRKKNKTITSWQNKWIQIPDSASALAGIVKLSSANDISRSILSVDAGTVGEIKFKLQTIFEKPVTLSRHGIALGYSWDLKTIYKNSLEESENFGREYWLGKEGFVLDNGKNEMIVYNQQKVSSLQLNVSGKQMIFNSDYSGDHPMLHFPLLEKSHDQFEDYSASEFNKGDTLICEFTISIITGTTNLPVLLSSQNGFAATFVWTEHADYTSMRTNRAVYFGSENIHRSDSAIGGFVKFSIPVTKSVFYSNPAPVDNADKAGFLRGPEATYKETEGFRDYLKELDESGMEICLHTPDHFTSERKLIDDALSGMRREFESVTWIDHGYDNAATSNREDLNCDGTDPQSKYFSADLWKKYGIKYLWNSFYEDSGLYAPYAYNSFFTVPYSGWNDPMPTPQYWRHNKRTGDLIHWRTTNTLDLADGSLWPYMFNDMRLNDLVKSRGTVVVHCYPARADSTTGFYDINNNTITANQGFNDALQKLSNYRSEGKIRLSTVKEMLEYRTSLEQLSYEFLNGGIVHLQNNGNTVIRGATFSAKANEIKSSKKEMKQKRMDDRLIFWLDIEAGETIDILLK